MNARLVITVAMIMLLWDFGPYGMTCVMCPYNRCPGNGVKEFWTYGIIFMVVCLLH
jgi:hypothetical protein